MPTLIRKFIGINLIILLKLIYCNTFTDKGWSSHIGLIAEMGAKPLIRFSKVIDCVFNSETTWSLKMSNDNVVKFKTREERDLEEILNAVKILEENGQFEIQDEEEEEKNWRP